jgi:glutathione synthase/RimK-type ligase-like ATP-grasp enzyme
MTAPQIALATCAALPDLDPDDRLLADALRALGVEVAAPVWDDAAVEWGAFDLVLVRSPWDYHLKRDAFLAWTRSVAAVTELRNPAHVVAWNTDKTYLRSLAERGVPTVPTEWVARGTAAPALATLLAARGWERGEAVVKPTVGLGSSGLLRIPAGDPDGAGARHLAELVADGDAMVQPFLPSLQEEGELSLLFCAGELSHAVRKRPVPGEFRVQPEFGATATAEQPSAAQVDVARRALACAGETLDYARVDLVADGDGAPLVMELELVEPTLYLEGAPGAAERFARRFAAVAGGEEDAMPLPAAAP